MEVVIFVIVFPIVKNYTIKKVGLISVLKFKLSSLKIRFNIILFLSIGLERFLRLRLIYKCWKFDCIDTTPLQHGLCVTSQSVMHLYFIIVYWKLKDFTALSAGMSNENPAEQGRAGYELVGRNSRYWCRICQGLWNGDLWAVVPLVRGSGCSCNLVQEISFHIVNFS